MNQTHHLFLAGDIGGTKTALALFSVEQGLRKPMAEAVFPNRRYASFEEVVKEFLADKDMPVAHASLGVAGPVINERAQLTNLPWVVDARVLSHSLGGVPVRLLNDLVAIAHAIPFLDASDLVTLNGGIAEQHGPLAVIAPGTGLGEAFLIWDGKRYLPVPSEGGHVDFAPTNSTELEMLAFLQPRLGHVSYEQVCSGKGLPNLYAFLKETGRLTEPDWLSAQLAATKDPTPVIVQAAIENKAEICVHALELFVSILGSETGNLALKVLAAGGVYLSGGIPPRILPLLKQKAFLASFTNKGRFSNWLSNVPVHVVTHPATALFGAACHGLEMADR